MKTVKIICGAYGQRVNGRTMSVRMGGTCQVDDQEAARLVGLKVAAYVEEAPADVPVQEGELSQEYVPPQEDGPVPENTPDEESISFSRDELDDMTKESLLKVASQLGLEANMRMSTGDAVKLLTPEKHQLDLRVAEEYWDTQETNVGIWPDKYVTIVRPKSFDPGSIAPMAAPGSKSQFVVYYFAAYRNGKGLWEIDKRNQKFVVLGKDYWADVRRALGE